MNKHRILGALAMALGAQGVTVAVSALTVLVLAGGLDASEYGMWQLYLLIGSYGGLLHFGLCDGVYLRLGGADYRTLDMAREGTLFRRMMSVQTVLVAAGILLITPVWGGSERVVAVVSALVYIPLFNAAAHLGNVLQATDNTVAYSVSVMIDRLIFALWVGVSVALGAGDVGVFIFGSITAKLVSLAYCAFRTRRLVFSSRACGVWSMARDDILSGCRLMSANLAGQLVTGAARFAIIYRYGDAEFGRVSLVMTLSGLFLQLISQLGMVLFPSLRRADGTACRHMFLRMDLAAGLILPAAFFAYLPLKAAVKVFLPDYFSGMRYLILLLPLCLFDGKTQLVGTMYLKVCGKVGKLMSLNVLAAALSVVLCFGVAYLDGGVGAVLLAAVVSAAVRCVLFDAVCFDGEGEWRRRTAAELVLCLIFSLSAACLPDLGALMIYAVCYCVYVYVGRRKMRALLG